MGKGVKPRRRIGQYKKTLLFVNFVLFIVPAAYYGYQPLLRFWASTVTIDEPPKKSDAIVVLAGSEPARAWGAADLYHQKFAGYVVLTKDQPTVNEEKLRSYGIELVDGRGNYIRVLRGFGVPEENIITVDTPVQDTFSELKEIRDFSEKRKWTSLIIVTSNYHTRRTRMTARYVLGPKFEVTVVATKHGGLNTTAWWKNKADVRTFLIEFEKLVAYTLYIWPRMVFS